MKGSTSATSFKFLTSNGPPSEAANDASRRRLVRTQAKRYSLKAHTSTSQRSSAAPQDISVYTGRLHLNLVPKQANENAGNGRPIRKYEQKVGILPKQDSDCVEAHKNLVSIYRPPPDQILSRSLDNGRLDPFDTLSIQTGAQEELLFQHVNAAFELPSYIFNAGASLFKLVSTDPAWFHATLSLIALHYDLSVGQEISRLSLYHRGEALRLVQWRLQERSDKFEDATIGAVASLVNFDAVIGDYASSTAHARGLTVMLVAMGGLQSLGENEVLQKIVGWSDLTYSATWKQKPSYDVISTTYCEGRVEHILALKRRFPPGKFRRIRGLDDDLNDVLGALQVLTALAESCPSMEHRERDLMRGIYIVEHALLRMSTEERALSHVRDAVILAFGLYLYMGLREMPRTAMILEKMVRRLKCALEVVEVTNVLDSVLCFWIASLGVVAATDREDVEFFAGMIEGVRRKLGLEGAEDGKRVLGSVVWTGRIGV